MTLLYSRQTCLLFGVDVTPEDGLREAIRRCGGSPLSLARRLGGKVVRQNVEYWLSSNRVPAEHCPAIERITEGAVTCEVLRPDVEWSVLRHGLVAESGGMRDAA